MYGMIVPIFLEYYDRLEHPPKTTALPFAVPEI
jgi:hypothetical protein